LAPLALTSTSIELSSNFSLYQQIPRVSKPLVFLNGGKLLWHWAYCLMLPPSRYNQGFGAFCGI
jgi:hypothetical protein